MAIAAVALLTIWAEKSAPLKNWLAALTGHHWTAKGVLMLAVYLVAAGVSLLRNEEPTAETVDSSFRILITVTILATLAVTGFFVLHEFGKI